MGKNKPCRPTATIPYFTNPKYRKGTKRVYSGLTAMATSWCRYLYRTVISNNPFFITISNSFSRESSLKPRRRKYTEMIITAIKTLRERSGSSLRAILKHILSSTKVPSGCEKSVGVNAILALRRGVTGGLVKKSGKSASFKLSKKELVTRPKKHATRTVTRNCSAKKVVRECEK